MFDPVFWSVAAAAAITVGFVKSGLLGSAGPLAVALLSLIVSPRDAAGILLPILLVMDAFAVWAYRRDFDHSILKILIPGALVGIGIGWATSSFVNDDMVLLLVGSITAVFILNTLTSFGKKLGSGQPSKTWGRFWGAMSGFTSFVSHAGGPPFQIYVLPQKLSPAAYAGTTAWFFAFVNISKLIPYYLLGQLSPANMSTATLLIPISIVSMLIGIYLVRRISLGLFYNIAYALVLILGVHLIYRGASGLLA